MYFRWDQRSLLPYHAVIRSIQAHKACTPPKTQCDIFDPPALHTGPALHSLIVFGRPGVEWSVKLHPVPPSWPMGAACSPCWRVNRRGKDNRRSRSSRDRCQSLWQEGVRITPQCCGPAKWSLPETISLVLRLEATFQCCFTSWETVL